MGTNRPAGVRGLNSEMALVQEASEEERMAALIDTISSYTVSKVTCSAVIPALPVRG